MIVEYNTTTKEITAAHYGRPYIASEWASYDVTGQAGLIVLMKKLLWENIL